jgi:two-component SAPR family response regulator
MSSARHVGLFYEGEANLWRQVSLLLQRCVAAGGRWLYVADERRAEVIQGALSAAGADPAGGAIIPTAALHFRDPAISIAAITQALEQTIRRARERKPDGPLLLLIEMGWATRTPSSTLLLREYEAAIDALAASAGLTIVCLYNQSIMLDRQLLNGLHTHDAICGPAGNLQPNPYFVPPTIFAQRDERAQFHHWLSRLGAHASETPGVGPDPAAPSGQLQPIYHFEVSTPLLTSEGDERRWQIGSLGQLRISRMSGEPVAWAVPGGATYKTKTLFAYLLFRGEEGAPTSELADLLWPEAASLQQSLNRLYHTVRCLRQALSPDLPVSRESPFILHRDDRYFLAVPPGTWIDIPVFQEHCYRGNLHQQNQQWEQALHCYQAAKQLYRGDLLADLPAKYTDHLEHDWCWSRRYWFRNMYLKVLREMAAIQRQLGNIPEALALCDEALRMDPCADMLHQEKMRVLHAANRRDALHRQYRLYCKALKQFDMGEPTEATTSLYHTLSR